MHGHAYCFLWTERTRPLAVNQNSGMIENNLQNIISAPLPSPQKERKMTMAAVNYCLTENSVDFLSQKKSSFFLLKECQTRNSFIQMFQYLHVSMKEEKKVKNSNRISFVTKQ